MSVSIVVGAQWGDEGKGKIVDLLSERIDIVARYQGGPNAGHTVVVNDEQIILHQIPSGILWPHTTCVIGNGVVVDPQVFMEEFNFVNSLGVDTAGRLLISDRAHLILPYHRKLDRENEEQQGENKIGTTGRGIGPAYVDKFSRIGLRVGDVLDKDDMIKKATAILDVHNKTLTQIYNTQPVAIDEIVAATEPFRAAVAGCIVDTSVHLAHAIDENKRLLLEGAQGTMLDVDYGTYPFVTSSNPTAGGACVGLGIGPTKIDEVIGIVKAYTTRVGMGPFPTEFDADFSEHVRTLGGEFGATTGRARRCGWFDAVVVRNAVRVNGLTSMVVTKLDVLDTLPEIKICTGYKYNGKVLPDYPATVKAQEQATPVLESHPGWEASTAAAKKWDDLPENAKKYLNRLSELTGTPIGIISVGPERNQTIFVD